MKIKYKKRLNIAHNWVLATAVYCIFIGLLSANYLISLLYVFIFFVMICVGKRLEIIMEKMK